MTHIRTASMPLVSRSLVSHTHGRFTRICETVEIESETLREEREFRKESGGGGRLIAERSAWRM